MPQNRRAGQLRSSLVLSEARSKTVLDPDELESLRQQALERRRVRITAIADAPERHGWPDRYLARARTKRGDYGVELGVLADALGCNPQALTSRVGASLGAVAMGSRAVDVYRPELLGELYDHPSIAKSREVRIRNLKDGERFDEVRAELARAGPYHLRNVTVSGFRSIESAEIPFQTLTVLIGKNAAGKSSLLDAIRLGLAPEEAFRELGRNSRLNLEFIATGESATTSQVAREVGAYCAIGMSDTLAVVLISIIEQLLTHPALIGKPGHWYAALSSEQRSSTSGSIAALLDAGDGKSRFAHELLRASLGDVSHSYSAISRLQSKAPSINITTLGAQESLGTRLFESMQEMARQPRWRFHSAYEGLAEDQEDDTVEEASDDEESDDAGGTAVASAEGYIQGSDGPERAAELEGTAGTLTLRWTDAEGDVALPASATHFEVSLDFGGDGNRWWRVGLIEAQEIRLLLEELSSLDASAAPEGLDRIARALAGLVGLFGPRREVATWFSNEAGDRVRTLACLYLVEAIANTLAPDFVAEAGRIVLLPPQHPGTEIVGVGLLGPDGAFTGINQLASGIARWVVLLADFAQSLAEQRWLAAPYFAGVVEHGEDEVGYARQLAARAQLPTMQRRAPIQLLLADEPELHLHPAAQEDIARWAAKVARESAILVATHAPAFLQLSSSEASLVRVSRDTQGQTATARLDGEFLQKVEALAADIGLGRERLLQLIRGMVVVEGEADASVMRRFASDVISRCRLAIVPIGGHTRAKSLADGDLAVAIGLPIAVMFDDTSAKDVARLQADRKAKVPDEVKSLVRVLSLAHRGVKCCPIHFEAPDIIAAIPEATVRRRFPTFTTWERIQQEWKEGSEVSFKNFVLDSWMVSRSRDLATIQELAADRRPEEPLPQGIHRAIKELEAWAETLGLATER